MVDETYDRKRIVAVYCTSVNCNPITQLLPLVSSVMQQLTRFRLRRSSRNPSVVAELPVTVGVHVLCTTPLQCVLTFIAVYLMVSLILVFRRLHWRQLASVWNCVDVMVVGLTWLSVVLFVVMMVHDASVQVSQSVVYVQSAACQCVWRCVNALLLTLLLVLVCVTCCTVPILWYR